MGAEPRLNSYKKLQSVSEQTKATIIEWLSGNEPKLCIYKSSSLGVTTEWQPGNESCLYSHILFIYAGVYMGKIRRLSRAYIEQQPGI